MKLYEMAKAPNPRRVRMFLAEKGLLDKVNRIEIDLAKGENLSTDFSAKNPMQKVPVLELDDGSCISETTAICRYFEEHYPDSPKLLGNDANEKAIIEQWNRWVDFYLFLPIGMGFQHTSGYFKDRMTPIKEWGEVNIGEAMKFFDFLNTHLKDKDFIVCERLTAADINAFCSVDFGRVVNLTVNESHPHLKHWYERIKSRASASV
ncbi:glutathione S-transferase family protein [Idiomarina seosinensis]|uniref:glutathione S-transferase family protein n=1 Tax=Idiomarina seosinensis TaxID=281739 RepID=UPI00384EA35B